MATIDVKSADRLALTVNVNLVSLFFQLLGHGFCVSVQTGCSVKELLCDQLGIHEDYLAERIQTIFLNAKVVDDVNSANVNDGSVLALSGAMPGLVGAILRSGGIYAGMRSQISHEKDTPTSQLKNGRITLKLWNLVVKELGPTFLQQGIWIKGEEIRSFIDRHSEELKTGCISVKLDGNSVEINHLQDITWNADLVFLQVISNK